jgi:hypothetical protein
MAERIPDRDELRKAMLWCARMWVGFDGKPFPGPIQVRVSQPEESTAQLLKPKGTMDGMTVPEWFALGEEGGLGVQVSDVLRLLLSPDEEKLLAALLSNQPCTASSVHERCKATLSKSDFWAVWGQLQKRQLVEQGEDEKYRIGPEWLASWLRAKRESDRPAA